MKPLLLICALLLFALPGCGYKTYDPGWIPPTTGVINHVVFFDLQDPADAEELIADCYDLLSFNPKSGYAGRHYDIGRSSVISDYDVGFFVAFNSEEEYRAYIEHPKHIALVEKWKSQWDSIRVYDVGDDRLLRSMSDQ